MSSQTKKSRTTFHGPPGSSHFPQTRQSAETRSRLNHTDAKEPQKESDTFNKLTKSFNKLQGKIILYMYF